MEPETAASPELEVEPVKPQSFFTRLGGVYTSPRNAFQEISQAPRVLIPLIVLIIVGLIFGFFLSRVLDLEAAAAAQLQAMVDQGRLTQQQMDQQLAMSSRFAGVQLLIVFSLGTLLSCLVIAAYAKLFTVFVAAENRFKGLLSVTLYSMIAVYIIQFGLMALVVWVKGPQNIDPAKINSVVASNLGAILAGLVGDDVLPKFIANLLRYVDAFAIWLISLLAIGYSRVSRGMKTSTAATWLAIAYAVIALLGAIAATVFNVQGLA